MDQKLLSRLTILLLDDNRNFLAIMRQILHALGVRKIVDATSAEGALEVLRNADIDIAFVDLRMPGLDGFEFAKLVRNSEDSVNRFLPMVMVTADARQATVKASINAGIEEFLVKPVRPRDVYMRIVRLVQNPHTYVQTKTYFGPERRRRSDSNRNITDRRAAPHNSCYIHNPHQIMVQDEFLKPQKEKVKHTGRFDEPMKGRALARPEEIEELIFL